jgi:hypothetical protein
MGRSSRKFAQIQFRPGMVPSSAPPGDQGYRPGGARYTNKNAFSVTALRRRASCGMPKKSRICVRAGGIFIRGALVGERTGRLTRFDVLGPARFPYPDKELKKFDTARQPPQAGAWQEARSASETAVCVASLLRLETSFCLRLACAPGFHKPLPRLRFGLPLDAGWWGGAKSVGKSFPLGGFVKPRGGANE